MVDVPSPFDALNLAIARLGSQAKLAELCEVSTTAVWKWVQSSKRLPADYALKVEARTGVSRTWLCPNIYPPGLVDGVPYDAEEPLLDVIAPIVPSNRRSNFDGRDQHANDHGRYYTVLR